MILIRKPDSEVNEFLVRLVDVIQSVVGNGSSTDEFFLRQILQEFLEAE